MAKISGDPQKIKTKKDSAKVLSEVQIFNNGEEIFIYNVENVKGIQMKFKGNAQIYPNDMSPTLKYYFFNKELLAFDLTGKSLPQYLLNYVGELNCYDIIICDNLANSRNITEVFVKNSDTAKNRDFIVTQDKSIIQKNNVKKTDKKVKKITMYQKQNFLSWKSEILDDISELLNVQINVDSSKEKIQKRNKVIKDMKNLSKIRSNLEKIKITAKQKDLYKKELIKILPEAVLKNSRADVRKKEDKGGY